MSFYGGIAKYDSSGNLMQSKVFSNSLYGNGLALKYFEPFFIKKLNSSNLILNGLITYSLSSIGFSADSFVDQAVISIDTNMKTKWATVIDFKQSFDTGFTFVVDNSSVYSGLFAGNQFPCFFSLNASTGLLELSRWFTSPSFNSNEMRDRYLM